MEGMTLSRVLATVTLLAAHVTLGAGECVSMCNGRVGIFTFCEDCSKFIHCTEREMFVKTCAQGSFFNARDGQCSSFEDGHCRLPEMDDDQAKSTNTPVAQGTRGELPPTFCLNRCTGVPDGFYAVCGDCTAFFSCKGGSGSKMFCPTGNFFDSIFGFCRADRKNCGTVPVPAQGAVSSQGSPVSTSATASLPCLDLGIAMPCRGLRDFPYPVCGDCRSFVVCTSGTHFRIQCPQGQNYDPSLGTCSLTVGCLPRILRGGSGDDALFRYPTSFSGCTVDCSNVSEGLHAFCGDCGSFVQCAQGQPTAVLACAFGTFFSPEGNICTHQRPRECIPTANTAAPVPPPTTTSPPPTIPPTTIKMPMPKPLVSNSSPTGCITSCLGMGDGRFARCGQCASFLTCISGKGFPDICPGGLAFNPTTLLCDRHTDCMATPPPPTTPPIAKPLMQTCRSDCLGAPNGLFELCQSDCTSFLVCLDNHGQVLHCRQGKFFDPSTESCVNRRPDQCSAPTTPAPTPPPKIKCVTRCDNEKDGTFAHCGDCSKFVLCKQSYTYELHCPPGKRFSAVTRRCQASLPDAECAFVHPGNGQPGNGRHGCISSCDGVADGFFVLCDGGCTSFAYCKNGDLYRLDCPAGKFFRASFLDCKGTDTSDCGTTAVGGSGGSTTGSCVSSCVGVPNGVFPSCASCQSFTVCIDGMAFTQHCDSMHFFSPKTRGCTDTDASSCAINTNPSRGGCVVSCKGAATGAHAFCGTCSSFVFCHEGRTLVLTCPAGYFYDPLTKACTSHSPTGCLTTGLLSGSSSNLCLTSCAGVADGSFADCASCERYIVCISGMVHTVPCPIFPQKTIFNAMTGKCVISQDMSICGKTPIAITTTTTTTTMAPVLTTPSTGQPCILDCKGRADGVNAWCTSCNNYINCAGGRNNILACPSGEIFHAIATSCGPDNPANRAYCGTKLQAASEGGPVLPKSCIFSCPPQSFGVFPQCDSCSSILVCLGLASNTIHCPAGKFYSLATNACTATSHTQNCP